MMPWICGFQHSGISRNYAEAVICLSLISAGAGTDIVLEAAPVDITGDTAQPWAELDWLNQYSSASKSWEQSALLGSSARPLYTADDGPQLPHQATEFGESILIEQQNQTEVENPFDKDGSDLRMEGLETKQCDTGFGEVSDRASSTWVFGDSFQDRRYCNFQLQGGWGQEVSPR